MALVLLAALGALTTARRRHPPTHALSTFSKAPFELIGIGLSLWLWLSLQNVSLEAGGTSAPAVQSGFLIMPLLLLLSVSILFARLASIGLRRAHGLTLRPGRSLAAWLAARRLAATPSLGMLMVGSVALAVGAFTYAGAIDAGSQEYTLTAKAQTLVGSNTAVTTPNLVRLPPSLHASSTEVLAETSGTVDSAPRIVIGVNPSSFENGAFWDSSYSGQPLGHLMQALAAAPASRHTIPVIAGGPAGFSLRPGLLLPYSTPAVARPVRVVGTATTFPGQNGSDPILITTRSELAHLDPAAYDQIWSKDTAAEVTATLRRQRHRLHLGAVGQHCARADSVRAAALDVPGPPGPGRAGRPVRVRGTLPVPHREEPSPSVVLRTRAQDGDEPPDPSSLRWALRSECLRGRTGDRHGHGLAGLCDGQRGAEPLPRHTPGDIPRHPVGQHRHHVVRGSTGVDLIVPVGPARDGKAIGCRSVQV